MAITTHVRLCILLVLFASAVACEDTPTDPTPIGNPQPLALAGTWRGPIGVVAGSTSTATATWTVSQNGLNVTGPISLLNLSTNVTLSGTLAGTLSGTRLTVTYSIPRGNVPGVPDCSMSGTGSLEASATIMSGTLNVTNTNCVGFTTETSTTNSVSLVKQ